MANAVKQVGADHFILATDLGQSGNPIHPDGYEMLVRGLEEEGIPRADIEKMMKDNPAKLLGLDKTS
jgi:microsomal dipeptidase-like Zn-dependent dipeptidase